MRDPKRIAETLEILRKYWEENPDLRLGQIVVNTATSAGVPDSGVYYMEDDTFVNFLIS